MSEPTAIPPKPAGSFRLLHTADWHLGKMLNDQSRDEEHGLFLDWLLKVVSSHAVDAILLAGDVFDTANPPQSALTRYYNFVSALFTRHKCSLVVIAGNHDSASLLEAPKLALRALDTHIAGALDDDPAARILTLPAAGPPRVGIALVPFLRDRDLRVGKGGESQDEVRAQIVAGIRQRYAETAAAVGSAAPGLPVIATGHLTVAGGKTSESERDIHIGGLGAVSPDAFPGGFAYVALGHLHRPQSAGGNGRIRYAGSPIMLSFSEADDTKEVRILDVTAGGITQHGLPVPVIRRLVRLSTTTARFRDDLQAFEPGDGPLPPWLEVTIEDAALADDWNERIQECAKGRGFDVLKVLRGRPAAASGIESDDLTHDEAMTLLDRPADVFDHLLQERAGELDAETIGKLKVAFAHLLEMDAQSQPTETR